MRTCERPIGVLGALVCCASLSLGVPQAHAQAEDQAAARALFDEGRGLVKAGHAEAACPKFEAAAKLFSGAGILLNLGDCYERTGRTASAWTEFGEAASVAARSHRPTEVEEARRRQAALEPQLVRLIIRVSHETEGLVVRRDGSVIAPAAWGARIPVDPGVHQIRAEAPGYQPWAASVDSGEPGSTAEIEVPALRPLRPAAPTESAGAPSATPRLPSDVPPPSEPDRAAPSRWPGWLLVGAGAAVGLGGGSLMIVESQRASDARAHHDVAAYDTTKTPWTIGLAGAVGGAAVVAGGVALVVAASGPGAKTGTGLASVWVSAGAGRIALGGAF